MLLVNKFLFLNKFKNIFMSVFVRKYINMEKKMRTARQNITNFLSNFTIFSFNKC